MEFEEVKEGEILKKIGEHISRKKENEKQGGESGELGDLKQGVFEAIGLLYQLYDSGLVPQETRHRLLKRIIQRLIRTHTAAQIEFNRNMTNVANGLAGKTQEITHHLKKLNKLLLDQEKRIQEFSDQIHQEREERKNLQKRLEAALSNQSDLIQEFNQHVQRIHHRIDEEKNAVYEIVEAVKKEVQEQLEAREASLHNRINDEKKGLLEVLDSAKGELIYKIDSQGESLHDRITQTFQNIHKRIDDEKESMRKSLPDFGTLDYKIQEAKDHASHLVEIVDQELKKLGEKLNPRNIFHLYQEENRTYDEIYFMLEENFRGTDEAISERQDFYQKRLSEHHESLGNKKGYYLDLGCGRGELLKLLRDNDIPVKGVDNSSRMIEHCKKRGLPVVLDNGLDYLKNLPDDHLRGIISLQVIEHLSIREMFEFFALSRQKLQPGGTLIVETVNPESVYALRWFYMDYTHNRPLPAPLVRFFFLAAGYDKVDVFLRSPVEGWKQLGITGKKGVIDDNFHKLNNFLFGYQDFAVQGIK